jgi:hypothetical protein
MIVIGCIAGLAIGVLAALAFLVWKNTDRAKELIFSLLTYEGLLTAEVCIETWYARRGRAGLRVHRVHPCVTCRDIAGDAAFVDAIKDHRDKDWVNDLVVPYAHAPAPACTASRAFPATGA